MIAEWILVLTVCIPHGQCEEYVVETFDSVNDCISVLPHVDYNGVQAVSCEIMYYEPQNKGS